MTIAIDPRFWSVIEASARDDQKLRAQLMGMSREELIRFYRDYIELAGVLRDPPYPDPGASENSAEELAWWIVAQGRDVYERIVEEPSRMPHALPAHCPGLGFISQIGNVFFTRFDDEITGVDLGSV